MKRLALAAALAACAGGFSLGAAAQSDVTPPLPQLSSEQSADVEQQLSLYRTEVNGRVARGEITAAEGERLLSWRRWQLAQAATGQASRASGVPPGPIADVPPGPIADAPPSTVVREYYYRPYYAPPPVYYYPPPVYYGSPAYFWGPRVCAGGFGHHFGGRVCF